MAKEGNSKSKKGLPKRADSKHPSHARNARCWERGEKRKDARRKAQAERETFNKRRGQTGWEIAKHNRKAKRIRRRRAEEAAARFDYSQ